jgi:hypothetical protein
MNDEQPRGNWYLLTGLIIGVALGVLFSVVLYPVRYQDSQPSALREDYRAAYRRLIAEAYQADGNLPRARERLNLLQDDDQQRALAAQAQRILADGGGPEDARPLALLAAALNGAPPEVTRPTAAPTDTPRPGQPTPAGTIDLGQAVSTPTPVLPTLTPRPTFTPRPSATPPRVLEAPFSLVNKSEVCDGSLPPARLAVEVKDKDGNPLAGVRIQVAWDGGQDTFYTGLVPEIDPGYADFTMQPGLSYTLRAGDAGDPVADLSIPACGGSWKIEFQEGAK